MFNITRHIFGWGNGVNLMINLARNFMSDESGAAAAEYALILAIVGAAIGGAAFLLGGAVSQSLTGAATVIKNCTIAADGTLPTGCK